MPPQTHRSSVASAPARALLPAERTTVLETLHVERFVDGLPEPKPVPAEVCINRPVKEVPQA